MSLEKNIQEFLGPQGLMVLQKALKQTKSDPANMVEFMESLQILPRAIISWAFNIAKNLPANGQRLSIPSTEYVLSLKKNDNKFDFEIIKKTEVVVSQQSVELPSVVLKVLELASSLDFVEKGFNDNMEDLQKAIDFLVKKFHFNIGTTTVTIDKNESSAKCEDCNGNIELNENKSKLCMCFRIFKNHLHIKKNINGNLTIHFSDKWDKKNIYLLMKTLKNKI